MTSEELAFAVETARGAGAVLMDKRTGPLTVDTKVSASDPVSEADRAAEDFIVRAISRAFPRDSVLGEEGAHVEGDSGRRWVIDPLDGTVNYLYKRDDFAVSIGLEDSGGPRVGVVHRPTDGVTYRAERRRGAFRDDRPTAVSTPASLENALLSTGFSYESAKRAEQARCLLEVLSVVRDIRRQGSAALDLASVASGASDLYFEQYIRPWDVLAGSVLVTESGGVVRTWQSAPGYLGIAAGSADAVGALLELVGHPKEQIA